MIVKNQVKIVEYRNFELGVLFRTSIKHGLQYRNISDTCELHGKNSSNATFQGADRLWSEAGADVILLPVPFDLLGGDEYYAPDNATFMHRPYMTNSEEVK